MTIGLISGAMGPFTNAPVDTIKTRRVILLGNIFSLLTFYHLGLQKTTFEPGQTALQRVAKITSDTWKNEGFASFYKGITPRVLRVAPGQAIVFAVYERVSRIMEKMKPTMWEDDGYSE
jgi:solute carrier family 25 citrate transporter 1